MAIAPFIAMKMLTALSAVLCGFGGVACGGADSEAENPTATQALAVSSNSSRSEMDDWLTQNVCVDASGNIPIRMVNGKYIVPDPFDCAGQGYQQRDLRPGELLPYHRLDQTGYQLHDSYPIYYGSGYASVKVRTIHTMDSHEQPVLLSDSHGTANPDRTAFLELDFDRATGGLLDGGDTISDALNESFYGWSSIIGTMVSNGRTQFFGGFLNACHPYGGWLLFPSGMASGQSTTATSLISGSPGYGRDLAFLNTTAYNKSCANDVFSLSNQTPWQMASTAWTAQSPWNQAITPASRAPITYLGTDARGQRKTMDSIVSYHFGTPRGVNDIGRAGSMERFFFTKEYGRTRWERWEPVGPNGETPATTTMRCDETDAMFGGTRFIQTACRDWSSFQPDVDFEASGRGWNPATRWLPREFANGNLLDNGDFGRGSMQSWDRWPSAGAVGYSVSRDMRAGTRVNNHFATFGKYQSGWGVVSQTVPVRFSGQDYATLTGPYGSFYEFGGTFWASGPSRNVLVRIVELDEAQNWLAYHDLSLTTGTTPAAKGASFQLTGANVKNLVYQIYMGDDSTGEFLNADDLYLKLSW